MDLEFNTQFPAMPDYISHSPAETEALGANFGRRARRGLVIALSGELGAGKTQFVKGLARGLDFSGQVHSPTFTLVNEYGGGRLKLFHLDLYRLETREQILLAGIEEYLQPEGVSVIEWAERIGNLRVGGCDLKKCASKSPATRSAESSMTILALEFSSARRSAALARSQGAMLAEAAVLSGSRGTDALGLIGQVLTAADLAREAIEVIAVGLGPGSYTGIRAAIAVAQGWQLARGTRLLGVSSMESLAAQAQAEKLFGRVNLVVDAQRGEFYLATWEISAIQLREIAPLRIVPAAEVAARKAAGELCAGPEMERRLFPTAAAVAALAGARADFLPGEKLEPVYLRETSFVKAPVGQMGSALT